MYNAFRGYVLFIFTILFLYFSTIDRFNLRIMLKKEHISQY